ncbi:lactose permease-like protein 1 [Elsinoe australis]|uniref:Lactose permease-like protein 1 n=1 Tax=Elsinoe australis TaxID=40998 RepID=A0A4U7BB86_9PEZI|nr:lactose permease-like protein 1 [Elsinoe australis]
MPPPAAKTTEDIALAINLEEVPPFWKRKNGMLLYFLLTSSFFSSLASGFDGSMTNAMQFLPVWQERFNHPRGSTLGLFGASNQIGAILPLILFPWLGDKYGRRVPTAIGATIIIVAALIQTFAINLGMFIGGKAILGIGTSIVQLGAPVLVTELCHPKERARFTSFYNTSINLGYVIGAWVTFGSAKIPTDWQWKLPTLLQAAPSIYQLALIYFSPESPRWLIAHNREEEALALLEKWHGDGGSPSGQRVVSVQFTEIKSALAFEAENRVSWRHFFTAPGNWKRVVLCTAVATFSQTSGNLLVSNYLPPILRDTGITNVTDTTLINGGVTLWSYLVGLAVALCIDRFPRRAFFLTGSGGVVVVFVAWTVAAQQYVDTDSLAAGRFVVAAVFLFQTFYTIAWLNLVVTYPLEILPYNLRAKGWSYVLLVIFVSGIYGNYINPVGIENLGWRFYIYYCVWVAVVFAFVYFFFVETRGPTLEELALLFEKDKRLKGVGKVVDEEEGGGEKRSLEGQERVEHKAE